MAKPFFFIDLAEVPPDDLPISILLGSDHNMLIVHSILRIYSSLDGSNQKGKDKMIHILDLCIIMILVVTSNGGQVNEESSDRILEVVQKYNEKRRPVYSKRNEIIKCIPDFWLTTIFKYIDTLKDEDFIDVKSGYYVIFYFKPNPYFENTKLSKIFTYGEGGLKIMGTDIKWKEGMVSADGVDHEKIGNK